MAPPPDNSESRRRPVAQPPSIAEVQILDPLAALHGANEQLERRVTELTRQLVAAADQHRAVEEQLREANRTVKLVLESVTDSFFGFSQDWRFTFLNPSAAAQMRALGKDPEQLIGRVLWEEIDDVPNEATIRRVMTERIPITDELYYAPLDRWNENHMYPSPDGGVVTLQKDITERKRADEQFKRCSNYLVDAERLSHVASWAVNVKTGELFWSAEHFRICGVDPDHFVPTTESTCGLIHPDDRDLVTGAFSRAVSEGGEIEWDVRLIRPDGSIRHVHSIGHPVINAAGEVTEYVGTIIDVTDRKRLEAERTQLVRRTMAAQENERGRIAREMHDQLGERLSALGMAIAQLRADCRRRPELNRHFETLDTVTKEIDTDIGSLVWELRPIALDDLGLAVALTTHAGRWGKRHGVEVQVRVSGLEKDRLSAETETTVYRITQEALTNVGKHAKARHVSVILERRPDYVFLMVEDDGVGFELGRTPLEGAGTWGLVGMRERAELVGGSLEFESHPGRGVTVVARLPDRRRGRRREQR